MSNEQQSEPPAPMIVRPGGNGAGSQIARTGFGTSELEQRRETQSTAVAARARAEVEARFVMALNRPRDWDDVRARILKDCARPSFAASAWYQIPRGGQKVEGFSIRFAEAAARHVGNLDISNMVIYDDTEKRIVKILVTDLESNLTFTADVVVRKVLERKQVNDKQTVLGERYNAYGQRTFLVAASDDELADKFGALASKAIRNLVLRVVPGDIRDECAAKIADVRASDVARDPDTAKKAVMDAFSSIGIMPATLAEYLGHSLDLVVPAEIEELRGLYQGIRDGDATWADAMAVKAKERETEAAAESEGKPSEAQQKLRDRMAKRGQKATTPPEGVPTEQPAAETKAEKPASKAKKGETAGEWPCSDCGAPISAGNRCTSCAG